jgi:hypothetical protein
MVMACGLLTSGCFMGDPGPPGPLALSSRDGQLVARLPSCAKGMIFGVSVATGEGSLRHLLWKVGKGPQLADDQTVVLGDEAGFSEVTVPWTAPTDQESIYATVVLGNYDYSFEGTFELSKVSEALNGGNAYEDRDITQERLNADGRDACT